MTDTATPEAAAETVEHEDGHAHASDLLYIKIALVLAVITGVEVAWPYIFDDGPVLMWPLLAMMLVKFVVIAGFFMHLRFDSKILTRIFYTGLALAVGVYLAALWTFTHGLNVFRGG